MAGVEWVGSVSGLRDGIEEVLDYDPSLIPRVSDEARAAIRRVDDAKADLWGRAPTIRMDRSAPDGDSGYRSSARDPVYR